MQNVAIPKKDSRFKKIVMSSGSSIILKIITFVCTFILTRLIISNYGSEINGMISSIAQFLGFITLLEGGLGGVARAVLYKPLANKNAEQINKIIRYLERFFRILSVIFVLYTVGVACIFPVFTEDFDYLFVFSLVLIVSVSTFAEYFFGMSCNVLLNADQKNYVSNVVTFFVSIANFGFSVLLILIGCNIHIVKLVSVGILVFKPLVLSIYCRKKYGIHRIKLDKNENLIPQKWSGLGVHIAYYLHRNTDIFLITIFLSLQMVSVYAVYNMIIGGILVIAESLSNGVESSLGNMFANKEYENLKDKFKLFVFYYQIICTVLLSCTLALIVPFVKLYTVNITDVDYIQPLFALMFIFAEFFYCLRVPYNYLMVATNSFRRIKIGAYIETGINIVLSLVLINFLGILGVAIGTLCAMIFRIIHFLYFFKKSELNFDFGWFIRNSICSILIMGLSVLEAYIFEKIGISNFGIWSLCGLIIAVTNVAICMLINYIGYRSEFKVFIRFLISKIKKGK